MCVALVAGVCRLRHGGGHFVRAAHRNRFAGTRPPPPTRTHAHTHAQNSRTERDRLDPADQIGQRRVLEQVLEQLPVRGPHELHAALGDRAARERLRLGPDFVDDHDLRHVVLDGLDLRVCIRVLCVGLVAALRCLNAVCRAHANELPSVCNSSCKDIHHEKAMPHHKQTLNHNTIVRETLWKSTTNGQNTTLSTL